MRWRSLLEIGVTLHWRTLYLKKAWCCGENWATRRPSLVLSVTWRISLNCRVTMRVRALYARRVSQSSEKSEIGQASRGRRTTKEMWLAIKVTQQPHGHYMNRVWRCFRNSMTTGASLARSLIWGACPENKGTIPQRTHCTGRV